ncbi:hypothetical protein M514_07639 [Trichuris suis]|uniref:Serine/threonine-protein phosphatase n=1 Tax=Trichuris suis TaxID=68888 RepID=A0A085N8F8_9BILA|nr:hypothetical protein M513_07639 [Trichuris suis]KFD65754.1 hypothetical protein M514_07639 [Trichuris suis]
MDLDDYMEEEYDFQYSDDTDSEPDVDLENQYYNSKAVKASHPYEALEGFKKVLELEKEKGEWGFRTLKQLVKLTCSLGMYNEMVEYYKLLLTYIKSAVTRNYSEKSINNILDHISSIKEMDLLELLYDSTLEVLKNARNDRLWFKTNIKLAKLYFDRRDFRSLSKILDELRHSCQSNGAVDELRKGTQLLEIYALEIQMYTEQKNNRKLKTFAYISLAEEEILFLIDKAIAALKADETLITVTPPIWICGDTHGQYFDLLRLFETGGWPPKSRYLFLGDYVDRGPKSIEVICIMFLFKSLYPRDFYILRGNHECAEINKVYGFYHECAGRYSENLFNKFQDAFDYLPLAALVGGRILCMHGGISPDLNSFEQVRLANRPLQVDEEGLFCDLLWADPDDAVTGWVNSSRGTSYLFGVNVVLEFCEKMNIDMIARAHQVVTSGYQFFAQKHLVTLFSAPNYCGEFANAAGMMFVDPTLRCRDLYEQSLRIKSAIPHPLIMGVVRECGGKMHLREGQFEEAHVDFLEAFKNYDESGNVRRVSCLKYLVLTSMLLKSGINPFHSQETKPYENDPEIFVMTQLVHAYQNDDLVNFQLIIEQNKDNVLGDPFIRERVEELLSNIRTQVLVKLIKPFTRIQLSFLADGLHVSLNEVKHLLAHAIRDNTVSGTIDSVNNVLTLTRTPEAVLSRRKAFANFRQALEECHEDIKENFS